MSEGIPNLLTNAILRILRPIARVLIRHEVSHAQFSDLARLAYVQAAKAHFGIKGRKMTHARMAVLTGLSRKEVSRLLKVDESEVTSTNTRNRAVRVIDGWLKDPEFQTNGKPKDLPLRGETGSFAALCTRYSGDVSLGAIVDELERVGVVKRPNKDTVVMASYGYIPHANELESVRIFSICAADLMLTGIHNLDSDPEQRRFQRQLTYPNVPKAVAEEFQIEAAFQSEQLLENLREFLASRTSGQSHTLTADTAHRVGLGIYYHERKNVEINHERQGKDENEIQK